MRIVLHHTRTEWNHIYYVSKNSLNSNGDFTSDLLSLTRCSGVPMIATYMVFHDETHSFDFSLILFKAFTVVINFDNQFTFLFLHCVCFSLHRVNLTFWSAEAEFAFSIYDADGSNKIDAFDLGDVLRALNTNPTLAYIEKLGGTKKRGEKLLSLEEFLPIYAEVKKNKEQGCYEDFIECLKLYDKNENGMMLLAELNHALLALGKFNMF